MARAVARTVALLAVATAALLGFAGTAPAGARLAERTALLLGDSLTTETWPDFHAPKGWRLESYAFPGMAPCDWLTGPGVNFYAMLRTHPKAVIIETAGNDFTRCMRVRGALPPRSSSAFVRRYEQALHVVFARSERAGAVVALLAPPPLLEPHVGTALDQITLWAFHTMHVFVATSPRLAVSRAGEFALHLPCLKSETAADGCSDGLIPVRMVDDKYHLHFCPYKADVTVLFTCAVYSSGQVRWARATMSVLARLP